jgi:hypothetical protein
MERTAFDRTAELTRGLMWKIDHIKRLPWRTPMMVSWGLIGAA